MVFRRSKIAGAVAVLIAAATTPVMAQPAAPDASTPEVFVHTSSDVTSKLALADRMAHLKQWDTAAEALQEIIDKYGDCVVSVEKEPDGSTVNYLGAAWAAQRRMSRWPADGLVAYRLKFGAKAAALLKQAGDDPVKLQQLFTRYFLTDAAKQAGQRLIAQSIAQGEFGAAADIAQRLLLHYPDLGQQRPQVLFAAAVSEHLCHRDDQADERLRQLQSQFPQARGQINGADVVLMDKLKQLLNQPAPARVEKANYWPTFGGQARRGRVSTGQTWTNAPPLLSIPLSKPTENHGVNIPTPAREDQSNRQRIDLTSGMQIDVMPVVLGDQLFFQDGAKIYGISLDSAQPLPGWLETYGGTNGAYDAGTPAMPAGAQLTVCAAGDDVLAVMGERARINPYGRFFMGAGGRHRAESRENPPRLVCLDRTTGKLRWTSTMQDLPEQGSLRSLALTGCPLAVGHDVYVLARGGKTGQFEDCYLLCFNRQDGKFRWACYIASASAGNLAFGGFERGPANDLSHLTFAAGQVFVQSNLGAVASVNAYDGNVNWLRIYPRQTASPEFSPMRAMGSGLTPPALPWTYNAPIAQDGNLFILPSDGQDLLVYDLFTGNPVKQIHLSDFDHPETLLAVQGSILFFASDTKLWAVNWHDYDAAKFAGGDQSSIDWCADVFDSPIRGRIFLTRDFAYVPTRNRLYRVDMHTGKIIDAYPSRGDWTTHESAGNVLVTDDKIIVAGAQRIDIYANPAQVLARLENEQKLHPHDIDLRLRHARLLFATNQLDGAMNQIDQAIAICRANHDTDGQGRIFDTIMQWERELSSSSAPSSTTARLQLFDRAGATARTPSERSAYLLARARLAHHQDELSAEITLLQQVLADAGLRAAEVPQGDHQYVNAAQVARSGIAKLIASGNASLYAPYEQKAAQQLESARAKNNPAEMLAVSEEFPNSSAAPAALRLAATACAASGQRELANQLLHQALLNYPGKIDSQKIMIDIAANDLAMNHLASAICWVQRLARQWPNGQLRVAVPNLDIQPRELKYADAAKYLQQAHHRLLSASLADLNLPADPTGPGNELASAQSSTPIPSNVDLLLSPAGNSSPADRIVTWTKGAGLSIYAAGQTSPIGTNQTVSARPIGLRWLNGDLLVWTSAKLFYLQGTTVQTIWQSNLDAQPELAGTSVAMTSQQIDTGNDTGESHQVLLPNGRQIFVRGGIIRVIQAGPGGDDAATAPDRTAASSEPAIDAVYATGDHIVLATTDGRLIGLGAGDGKLAWQTRLGTEPIRRIVFNDYFIAARIASQNQVSIVVVDTFTGQVLRQIASSNANPPVNLGLSPDNWLVVTLEDRICQADLDAPATASISSKSQDLHFDGLDRADQLLIAGHQMLALSDSGMILRLGAIGGDDDNVHFKSTLGIGAADGAPTLQRAGDSAYIVGGDSLTAFDLRTQTGNRWTVPSAAKITRTVITRNDLLLVSEPKPNTVDLLIYGRSPTAHGQSGRLNYIIHLPAGADSIQAVEGGLYYLTPDHRLHFLATSHQQQ